MQGEEWRNGGGGGKIDMEGGGKMLGGRVETGREKGIKGE